MTVCECLSALAYRLIAETGTGGLIRMTLTNEAYDKLTLELGAKVISIETVCDTQLKLFLGDRYVMVTRDTKYENTIR